MATVQLPALVGGPDHGPALETLFLATTALVELRPGTGDSRGPAGRSRSPSARTDPSCCPRLQQQLEVWARVFPVALAAPALDHAEI